MTHIPSTHSAPPGPDGVTQLKLGGASVFVALLVFLSTGYFQNSRPGWNVNSQFALTCAIVEGRTLSIDAYHDDPVMGTGDKAYFEGRFYSDKSPVTPFLGVPAFAAYRALCLSAGQPIDYNVARFWTTFWTMGLLAAGFVLLITLLFLRAGIPEPVAATISGLWVMATPLLGYSILFFNYLPSVTMALGGYLLVQEAFHRHGEGKKSWPRIWKFFLGGMLLGLACWTLQTLALLAALMSGGLLWAAWSATGVRLSSRLAAAGAWALGGILGVGGYAIYSLVIFGEVTSPYRYEFDPHFKEEMAKGLMGAGWPNLKVLQLTTFHPFRGLFFLFPVTLLAALGCIGMMRRRDWRVPALIALLYLVGLLLYNAGYYMWWGGWAYAPRNLIPALALLPIGLIPWIANPGGRLRPFSLGLLLLVAVSGAVTNVGVVAIDPQPPPFLENEVLYVPETVEDWPAPNFRMLGYVGQGQTDQNVGQALGLRGWASLAPLGLLWLLVLVALISLRGIPWAALAALMSIGTVALTLRIFQMGEVPPGLWFDEALNAQDALTASIADRYRLVYTEVFPREPMFVTILAGVMKAGFTSLESLRLTSVVIGLMTVFALFGMHRTAGEKGLALAAPAVLASMRWHAVMSRLLFRTLLLPFWIVLIVWTSFAIRRKPTLTRAVLLGVLVGGGFYTYLAWYFVLPGVMLLMGWAFWPILRRRSQRWLAAVCLTIAGIVAAPLGWDYVRHPEHIISRPQAVSLGGEDAGWSGIVSEIRKNTFDVLGMFHLRGDHVPTVNLPESPALDPLMGLIFVVGLVWCVWGIVRKRPLEMILLGWLALGLAPTIFTKTDSPNFLRTLVATPAVASIAALGLVRPGQWLTTRFRRGWIRSAWVALASLVILISSLMSGRDIYLRWARDERVWRGFNAAEAQIGRSVRSAPQGVSVWIPESLRNHRTVRFLTWDLNAIHSYRDFAFLRPMGETQGPRWVVVTLHNQLFPVLQELVPEGRVVTAYSWPDGGTWGLIYEIPEGRLPSAREVFEAETRHPVADISW